MTRSYSEEEFSNYIFGMDRLKEETCGNYLRCTDKQGRLATEGGGGKGNMVVWRAGEDKMTVWRGVGEVGVKLAHPWWGEGEVIPSLIPMCMYTGMSSPNDNSNCDLNKTKKANTIYWYYLPSSILNLHKAEILNATTAMMGK